MTQALPPRPLGQDPKLPHGAWPALCILACALLAPAAPAREPPAWSLDPEHSQVWFRVDHQGYSRPLGRVPIRSGGFRFDARDWSTASVRVELDPAAIDMGVPRWNRMLHSRQLLDSTRWPTARYTSRSVERTGEATGVIHGELELRGKRRPVDVRFRLNRAAPDPYTLQRKVGFSAEATLERSDFGIDRYPEAIGSKVAILIEIEGVPAPNHTEPSPGHAAQE